MHLPDYLSLAHSKYVARGYEGGAVYLPGVDDRQQDAHAEAAAHSHTLRQGACCCP